MSFEQKTWASGERITADELNRIEAGIAGSSAAVPTIQNDISTLKQSSSNLSSQLNNLDGRISNISVKVDQTVTNIENEDNEIIITKSDNSTSRFTLPEGGPASVFYDEQYYLHFQDENGDEMYDGPFYIQGGGGGGGSSTSAKFSARKYENWATRTIAVGSSCAAVIEWSSIEDEVPTGDGSLKVIVSGFTRLTKSIPQGIVTVDLTPYLKEGQNTIALEVTDTYGSSRQLKYTIEMVSLNITSNFDNTTPYIGDFTFTCNMTGNVSNRQIHLEIDNIEQETVIENTKSHTFTITTLAHGQHTMRLWFTSIINEETVSSNILYYEFMFIDPESYDPIILSDFTATSVDQYTIVRIPFIVYDAHNNTTNITVSVNGEPVSSLIATNQEPATYSYLANTIGTVTIRIAASTNIYRDFTFEVNESSLQIEPEQTELQLYLSAAGRSNAEANRNVWTYNNIGASFNNFTWILDGWQTDGEGYNILRLSGDARVTIPFAIFSDQNLITQGRTIELEFATREVSDYTATIFQCWDNNRGLKITPQSVSIRGNQTEIGTIYKDNEHIRLTITIDASTGNKLILIYINGIMSRAVQYANTESFEQSAYIEIGSSDCGIDIYNMRVYKKALTPRQVVNNWIADTQLTTKKIERYERNQVYNEQEAITIESLKNTVPYMVIEATELPQFKDDVKVASGRFYDPTDNNKTFTFEGCEIDVQGTSSSVYYVKNIDMKFKQGFNMNNGTHTETYALYTDSIPFNRFVLKADVASSESSNNTELTMFYNDTCPYKIPEMQTNNKVRWGIEGRPIVMFWHNPSTNITKFMGKYNFNLPKRADKPYGYDAENNNDESWEWERNNSNNVIFKDDDFTTIIRDELTQTEKPEWYDDFEARFPSDKWRDITQLKAFISFIKSTDREQATNKILSEPVTYTLANTSFLINYDANNDGYTLDGLTATFTKDNAPYRLAKFQVEFPNYAELQSAFYYYLFTELFLMIDSRAKNMFVGFHGSTINDPNFPLKRKAVFEPYDMDTAVGTNNSGVLMFGYNLEDTDTVDSIISGSDESGSRAQVYNAQASVLWCNLRDTYRGDLVNMYRSLRTGNTTAWSYNAIETRYENHQRTWCENIFNEDSYEKYLIPLIEPVTKDEEGNLIRTTRYLTMLQGSKQEQRKWWLYNRFRYLDSKYFTGNAANNTIDIRLFNDGTLSIKTAVDMYATVKFGQGSTPMMRRTEANTTTEFTYTYNAQEMETSIYSADLITDVGDLSQFYPNECNFSRATRLKKLKIGDSDSNYHNDNLNDINVQNSSMLEEIDCRNCPNLAQSIDLSGSPKLKRAYFEGTSITSVSLANGGEIETLHLPNTITSLELLNLNKLEDLTITSNNYSNIDTLIIDNTQLIYNNIDTILDNIAANARISLKGFNMTMTNTQDIDDFLAKLDSKKGINRVWDAIHNTWIYTNYDTAQNTVVGTINISQLTGAQIAAYQARYPLITFNADSVISTIYYYDWEGVTILHQETVEKGQNGIANIAPSHASTIEKDFTFIGWSRNKRSTVADDAARQNIIGDRKVYAAYNLTTRKYNIKFKWSYMSVSGTTLLDTSVTTPEYEYGSIINFDFSDRLSQFPPVYPYETDREFYEQQGWMTTEGLIYEPGQTTVGGAYEFEPRWIDTRSDLVTYLKGTMYKLDNNNITKVRPYAFYTYSNLNTINLTAPDGVELGSYSFNSARPLDGKIHINATQINSYAMGINNTTPAIIELTSPTDTTINISGDAFSGAQKLKSIIIDSNNVSILGSTSWIVNSSIIGYRGGIYVPNNLLASYNNATNWSNVAEHIYPIHKENNEYILLENFDSITDDWPTIIANIDNGTYSTVYHVGDTKTMILNDTNQTHIMMQIAAFDTDILADNITQTAKVTWLAQDTINLRMNYFYPNWADSSIRQYLNNIEDESFQSQLPNEIRERLVAVKKSTSMWSSTENKLIEEYTNDTLWIPSNKELCLSESSEQNGVQYSYYNTASRRIKFNATSDTITSYDMRTDFSKTNLATIMTSGNVSSRINYNRDSASLQSLNYSIGFCLN